MMHRTPARRGLAVSIALISAAGCLVSCAPEYSTAQLSVEYVVDGEASTTEDISLSDVTCTHTEINSGATSATLVDRDIPRFTATMPEPPTKNVGYGTALKLSGDLWFISNAPFTFEGKTVAFDALAGNVGHTRDNGRPPIDMVGEATLTGTVTCR